MNKGQLIDKVAAETGFPKNQCDTVLGALFDQITETVASGDKVTLVGFGVFERRDRKERLGRNPKTGEEMVIPASKVPAFSAGKAFKEQVKAA